MIIIIKLLSIITPLYNSENYIEETIKSVQSQTYTDWEMIIIDDCSSDNGVRIVENYMKSDEKIKLIQLKENSGGAIARNTGIKEAKGEYIAFLDSDDLWHQEKLEKQIKFMEDNKFYFTYTWYEKISEKGELLNSIVKSKSKVDYKELLKSNQIGCLTAIYNQEKFGKIYMPNIKKRQDYAMWLEILKKIDYGYCLEENLGFYRVRENSVSSNKLDLIKYNFNLFYKIQKLSLFKSIHYLGCNILTKLIIKK